MDVLYHIRQYVAGIFPYIDLIYGRYLQFRSLNWQLNSWGTGWGPQDSVQLPCKWLNYGLW